MFASFKRAFMPTADEQAKDADYLRELTMKAVSESRCGVCDNCGYVDYGKGGFEHVCKLTGDFVTGKQGLECFTYSGKAIDVLLGGADNLRETG